MSDDRNQPFGLPGSGLGSSGIPGTGGSGLPGIPGSGSPAPSPRPQPGPAPERPSLQKPSFQIPAPQQPLAGTEAMVLAGWGARLGAHLLDMLFRALIALPLPVLAFALLADDPFSTVNVDPPDGISNLGGIGVTWLLLYSLSAFFYAPITMARSAGATPGKRIAGIRVVTDAGAAPTFGQAFLREPILKGIVVNGIGGTIFLPALLNYLWPLWDEQSRAGHDFMAKTRVIRATN